MTNPMTMTKLTFIFHLHVPPAFVPCFPYVNLDVFSALLRWSWDVSLLSSQCWPHWNKCLLISPLLLFLPLAFVSGEWPSLVCLWPPHQGLFHPSTLVTADNQEAIWSTNILKGHCLTVFVHPFSQIKSWGAPHPHPQAHQHTEEQSSNLGWISMFSLSILSSLSWIHAS